MSANSMVQNGPANTRVRSRIRTPFNAPVSVCNKFIVAFILPVFFPMENTRCELTIFYIANIVPNWFESTPIEKALKFSAFHPDYEIIIRIILNN